MVDTALDPKHIDLDSLPLRSRHRTVLRVAMPNGNSTIDVPVHILVGNRHRQRFAAVGGVHGDEYDGIRAAQRLAMEEDVANLHGVLVVIPIANPSAFDAGQRKTAIDGVDLNRVFPGNPEGGAAERLAHELCDKVLRHMDLVFTLHGAGAVTELARYLEFFDTDGDVGRKSYAAAVAAGFKDLIAFPETRGYLLSSLGRAGIPVIEGEVGGRGELHEENAAYYLARINAVMQHLAIKPGKPPEASPPNVWRAVEVTASVSGVLSREASLYGNVARGQRLGCIRDSDGAELAEIVAPADGMIGGLRAHARIHAGDMAFRVFVPAEAKPAFTT